MRYADRWRRSRQMSECAIEVLATLVVAVGVIAFVVSVYNLGKKIGKGDDMGINALTVAVKLRQRVEELEEENERLKAKLTQDPKDARCQLYKQTQHYQAEAERLNAENERLLKSILHSDQYKAGLERAAELEAVNKRLLAALEYFIKYGYDEDVCKKAHDGVAYDE
jgi:hypothetical protein